MKALLPMTSVEAHRAGVLDLCIWAHSLSGELDKALWHYRWLREQKVRLKSESWATIYFALGVAHTRVSEYGRAREFFGRNRRFRKSSKPMARFFLWQGLGFYRFFTGSYLRSAAYASRALEFASQEKFKFGAALAEELLSYALIESNQVRRGMKHMRGALEKARELKHEYCQKSWSLNLILNEARFGLNWQSVPALEKALDKLHPTDSYSRNSVKLELSNQLTLRGRTRRAYEVLDEACDSIYASRNRRQIAQLNFRLAFLTWLRGGQEEAMHLLRSAETQLHREVDLALLVKMRGLQNLISKRPMSLQSGRELGLGVHARILKRMGVVARREMPVGEDRLGDLYDLIAARDPEGLRLALNNGLYYFVHPYFGVSLQQRALLFDLLPKGLLVVDHGNVQVVGHGLSRVLRRILEVLAVSHQNKAELIQNVWGYQYDASRHDALVYTSISKIRQLLGEAGSWIEADEKGYRLRSGVLLQTEQSRATRKPLVNIIPAGANTKLNFRQLRILSTFASTSKQVVAVDDVMRDFEVSRATATRDLGTLTEEGFLRRFGQARATRYARTEKEISS